MLNRRAKKEAALEEEKQRKLQMALAAQAEEAQKMAGEAAANTKRTKDEVERLRRATEVD